MEDDIYVRCLDSLRQAPPRLAADEGKTRILQAQDEQHWIFPDQDNTSVDTTIENKQCRQVRGHGTALTALPFSPRKGVREGLSGDQLLNDHTRDGLHTNSFVVYRASGSCASLGTRSVVTPCTLTSLTIPSFRCQPNSDIWHVSSLHLELGTIPIRVVIVNNSSTCSDITRARSLRSVEAVQTSATARA